MMSLLAILALTTGAMAGGQPAPAFLSGERLTYRIRYGVVTAGTAVFEIADAELADGTPVYHFTLTAQTNAAFDKLYKVRDRLESMTLTDLTRSHHFRQQQHEGRHQRDVRVVFDWPNRQAICHRDNEALAPVELTEDTLDPLAVFYAFRGAKVELKEGATVNLSATDGRRVAAGSATVIRRETVKVAGQPYETWLIRPDLKGLRGAFAKSKGASVEIWVTDDARRLPVRITSKVAVGKFTLELLHDGVAAAEQSP